MSRRIAAVAVTPPAATPSSAPAAEPIGGDSLRGRGLDRAAVRPSAQERGAGRPQLSLAKRRMAR